MNKRVADVTAEELEKLAREAWGEAAREALAKGLSITGSYDGRRYRYHPDGRIDGLGSVAGETIKSPFGKSKKPKKSRKALA
jgi:hypothetical protein